MQGLFRYNGQQHRQGFGARRHCWICQVSLGPINVTAVSRNHSLFIQQLDLAIDKHAVLAGEFAQADVRMNPQGFKHRSGNIARSTEYKIIRTARGRLVKILNTAKYARPLEKGHKPFFVRPR